MIHWILLISRQGKVRLAKWFESSSESARAKITRDVITLVLPRNQKMCNVVDWKGSKVVYKRYASLYFVAEIDPDDNELLTMQLLHMYVEVLDQYFTQVCELDLIFNFPRAHWILNEIFVSGELMECNKSAIINAVGSADVLAERAPKYGPSARTHDGIGTSSSSRRYA